MDVKEPGVRFFKPHSVGERAWGEEILVAHEEKLYTGKILKIHAGCKGGLQKHRQKNESAYVVSGEMIFRHVDDHGELVETRLGEGDCVHIPPGAIHQEEAVTDCVIFEVSTPHFNDRVRMESRFGLAENGGLPTTSAEEIEFR